MATGFWLTVVNQIGIAAIGAIGLNILVGYTGQISLGQGGFLAVGAYTSGVLVANAGLPVSWPSWSRCWSRRPSGRCSGCQRCGSRACTWRSPRWPPS